MAVCWRFTTTKFSYILHPGPSQTPFSFLAHVRKGCKQPPLVLRTSSSINTIAVITADKVTQRGRAPSLGVRRRRSKKKKSRRVFPLVAACCQTLSFELKGIVNKAGWGGSHSPMCLALGGREGLFLLSCRVEVRKKRQEGQKEKCSF